MIGYVQLFLRNGYNVLTPDWRAHGESGGELATYGIKEKDDVTSWINWLQSSTDSKKYYALGESYGAAVLLQSLEISEFAQRQQNLHLPHFGKLHMTAVDNSSEQVILQEEQCSFLQLKQQSGQLHGNIHLILMKSAH